MTNAEKVKAWRVKLALEGKCIWCARPAEKTLCPECEEKNRKRTNAHTRANRPRRNLRNA